MSKVTTSFHETNPDPKQIKIPYDGQLSKKGTVIKNTRIARDVDYSIAEIVEKINKAGFKSQFSCSGLKKDHPLTNVNPDGAYISFLYEENAASALLLIEKAALSLNLTVEYCKMSRNPALIVRIDRDNAGKSLYDRIIPANKNRSRLYSSDFGNSFGADTKDLDAIVRNNGGLIYDTDEKLETAWKKFGARLLYLRYPNAS